MKTKTAIRKLLINGIALASPDFEVVCLANTQLISYLNKSPAKMRVLFNRIGEKLVFCKIDATVGNTPIHSFLNDSDGEIPVRYDEDRMCDFLESGDFYLIHESVYEGFYDWASEECGEECMTELTAHVIRPLPHSPEKSGLIGIRVIDPDRNYQDYGHYFLFGLPKENSNIKDLLEDLAFFNFSELVSIALKSGMCSDSKPSIH